MTDVIITGASRGIGRALALALAGRAEDRLILVARSGEDLASLAREIQAKRRRALVVPGDLASIASARDLGARLSQVVEKGATLVHNAGIWPAARELTGEGLERSFVVNHMGPLAMQRPLIEAGLVRRIMVVGAGLMIKGRFDPARTPRGEDFSSIRTYATTKLCFALAMRDVAEKHPEIDVAVLHPGVVRTDLGARSGPIGWLVALVKRRWEDPEICAERLVRILGRERLSAPGEARWLVEEAETPWPDVAENADVRESVRNVTARLFAQ
jgi:NAD(P)-dependent dehydrogenase (short-subunit alcohol dehydrogenase family)